MLKNTTVKHYPELTAIHRKTLSFPSRFLYENNYLKGEILDFGSGHGKDTEVLNNKGLEVDCYDDYYAPLFPTKKYNTIVCHYVLNVLDKIEQTKVLAEVSFLLKPGGQAFFTVRRDLKQEGIRMHAIYKKPTFQCNVILPFISVFKNKHCEIYVYQKGQDSALILETVSIEVVQWKGRATCVPKINDKEKVKKATEIVKQVLQKRNKKHLL